MHTPVLPQETEIERIVLGAAMLRDDPKQIEQIRRELEPGAFTVPFHREVFGAICALRDRDGESVDPMSLWKEMEARGAIYKDLPLRISELTNGVPPLSNLKAEIRRLREVYTRREIMRCANTWLVEAQVRDVDVGALVGSMATRVEDFGRNATVKPSAPLSISWAEACVMEFPPWESILNGIGRGEVVNCSAITERGKSTLWRNICLSAATGREFAPFIKAGPQRRILYLDFETRWPRLRPDIMKMLGRFTQPERAMVASNLHIIADCRIDGLSLSLSDRKHWAFFEAEVERVRPDIVVIDTLSVAFNIQNELDNSEAVRNMKRLCGLAEKFACVVVFLHHIGKVKQEEGQTAYAVYRSRGASAYSANAQAIINLLPDLTNKDRFTMECPKLKGEKWADTVFDIDRASRWCVSAGSPDPVVSSYDRLVGAFNGLPLSRSDLETLLPDVPKSSLTRHLKEAIERGDLDSPERGTYIKTSKCSNAHPYRDEHLSISETPQNQQDTDTDFSGEHLVSICENLETDEWEAPWDDDEPIH